MTHRSSLCAPRSLGQRDNPQGRDGHLFWVSGCTFFSWSTRLLGDLTALGAAGVLETKVVVWKKVQVPLRRGAYPCSCKKIVSSTRRPEG